MKSSVRRNYVYNLVYQILTIILPLITTPYISRVLGADGIGLYSYTHSIANYFVIFAMLGLNNYGNRTIAMVREDIDKLSHTFISIYALQITMALISCIGYAIYILMFNHNLMTIILFIYVISSLFDVNWFFFGLEQFKLTITRNIIIKLLSVTCVFIFVIEPNDIYKYGIIMALSSLLSQVVIWPFILKNIRFCKISVHDVLSHLKPNLILFLPVVAISLYKIMDKIMLGTMTSMREVGLYENAEKIIFLPNMMITALGTVMLPKMSYLVAKGDKESSYRYIYFSLILAAFFSTALCFGIMGIGEEFIPLFMGAGFEKCVDILKILLPSCMFVSFANVIRTQYIIPNKADKLYVVSVFLGAIVNVILNLLLIPKGMALGAAIGTLCAEIVVFVYQYAKIRKEINVSKPLMASVPFIVSGLIMYIILEWITLSCNSDIIVLVIKVFLGVIIYCTCLIAILSIRKYVFKHDSIFNYK